MRWTAFVILALLPTNLAPQAAAQPSRRDLLERNGIVWDSAAAWGRPFAENLSEDVKIAGLSRLWMEVKMNFPNFAQIPDVDWDETFIDYIPKIRATSSTYDYYVVLQQMSALLKDAHTGVFMPRELKDREGEPPLRLDLIENRVFVTRVGSESLESTGVSAGMEVVEVEGVDVRDYANVHQRPRLSSNTQAHAELIVHTQGLLTGPRDRPVLVKFRRKDGRALERQISRNSFADASTLPGFEYRRLPGNLAYVAINSFAGPNVEAEFEQHLADIRATDGLIIDVRENDGGSGVVAYNILGHLVDKDFPLPQWKARQYIPTLRAWGDPGGWYESEPRLWPAKPSDYYAKPVVILTGPRSLSATDVFAETFRRIKRGRIVGEPTGGSTGDPLGFALPGGGAARVATSANLGPVPPDTLVPRTVRDFLEGRDRCLEVGVSEITRLIQSARK